MTDGLTVAFILSYFPISQPCQQPASAFCSFHCTLWSKILHSFLNATKISLFWSQTTHVQELTVVLCVLVPGRRQNCLFCHGESRRALAPCGHPLADDRTPYKVLESCSALVLTDSHPEFSLSPSLVLTELWDWPQRNDGEYKMLQCFQESKLAPLPA